MKTQQTTKLAFLRETGDGEVEIVVITHNGHELTHAVNTRMALNWIELLATALRSKLS